MPDSNLSELISCAMSCIARKEYISCYAEAEGFAHIHLHVFAKPADLPEELKGGKSFNLLKVSREEAVPPAEIIAFCELLQNKFEQQAIGGKGDTGEFFDGNEESRHLFDCLREMIESIGPVEMVVQQSQIAFPGTRLSRMPGGPADICEAGVRRWF